MNDWRVCGRTEDDRRRLVCVETRHVTVRKPHVRRREEGDGPRGTCLYSCCLAVALVPYVLTRSTRLSLVIIRFWRTFAYRNFFFSISEPKTVCTCTRIRSNEIRFKRVVTVAPRGLPRTRYASIAQRRRGKKSRECRARVSPHRRKSSTVSRRDVHPVHSAASAITCLRGGRRR